MNRAVTYVSKNNVHTLILKTLLLKTVNHHEPSVSHNLFDINRLLNTGLPKPSICKNTVSVKHNKQKCDTTTYVCKYFIYVYVWLRSKLFCFMLLYIFKPCFLKILYNFILCHVKHFHISKVKFTNLLSSKKSTFSLYLGIFCL